MKTRSRSSNNVFANLAMFVLIALITPLGINGCEPRATDPTASEKTSNNVQPQNVATIRGSLAPDAGNVANIQMLVFYIQPDGTLQNITVGDSHTDSEGRFEVLAKINNPPLSNVIVEARTPMKAVIDEKQKDKTTDMPTRLASALLLPPLKLGEVIKTPILNFETTLEADIYVQAHNLAEWDPVLCNEAELRLAVTPEISKALRTSEDYNAQAAILAGLTTTGMRAFTATLLRDPAFQDKATREGRHEIEPGFRREGIRKSFSKEDIQKAHDAFHQDVQKFDQRRNNPNDEPADHRARQILSNDLVQSYLDNDINIHILASANQAASEAALAMLPQLEPTVRAAVLSNIEVQRARFITRAIQDDFSTLGGPHEASTAVENAGVTLRNKLAALAVHTDDITSEVHSVWQQYLQRVEEILQTTFTAEQRQVVQQMQSDIVPATRTMFNTIENLTPDATTEDIASTSADAVLLFHKDTSTLAYSELWKNADINDKRANAILDILLNFATIR